LKYSRRNGREGAGANFLKEAISRRKARGSGSRKKLGRRLTTVTREKISKG
jgi:hypothetical protein